MALVQIVSNTGQEDYFLTNDPQITLFKCVYRRNTIFSMFTIPQYFNTKVDFGHKYNCQIMNNGDLVCSATLLVTLPSIPQLYNLDQTVNEYVKFAWVRKIGFAIIQEISFNIDNMEIERHTGEWLNIWYQLTKPSDDYDEMIGNIEKLYKYDKTKDEFTLLIPIPFWFSKSPSNALPLCCLKNHKINITLQLEDFEKCYKITPTHYILMENYNCQFKEDEYIIQNINGEEIVGQFNFFDSTNKRLYYSQISKALFKMPDYNNDNIEEYYIKGLTSNYFALPHIKKEDDEDIDENKYSIVYKYRDLTNINISECYMIIDYIALEEDEKIRFYKNSHQYLVEQINETTTTTFSSKYSTCKLNVDNPVKYLVWFCYQNNLNELYNNDKFNYTNSYKYNDILYDKVNYKDSFTEDIILNNETYTLQYNYNNNPILNNKYNNNQVGESLIKYDKLLFNGVKRINESDKYFNIIQSLEYFYNKPQKGLHIYTFALYPLDNQPSGTCNMHKIDNVQLDLILDDCINLNNTATFKCYSVSYNVLRVYAGYGKLVFVN